MSKELADQDPLLLRRLLRAKDGMDAAPQEDWPVRRLAAISHLSEAHFARAFKDAFGIPPHRYLLTRRIEKATALLRDTELPITDIAFQTGWQSLGTFGRIFRDIKGENPGAFRERAQAGAQGIGSVPGCILSAAHRPDLKTAVSEKRRRQGEDKNEAQPKEVNHEPGCTGSGSLRKGPG
ncbi:helix-turn-helix transcriptional regulator [Gallaecimonas kandeliae]|uniref:helix-turn-helix transcriptional regulator n=1 Tax=Gallaecimonas kandeliae TaxID=3029055 RepID=UPI00264876C4|nr:helix-turn-helix transcriptional regulator [Gallaecimonas kandeliae]WKE65514.1 helix-turn-helix transcriptional regulator [Gallaecimonas kandeliae]